MADQGRTQELDEPKRSQGDQISFKNLEIIKPDDKTSGNKSRKKDKMSALISDLMKDLSEMEAIE